MKSKRLKELFKYWVMLKGDRHAPERADLHPGTIRHLLNDMFILETNNPAEPKLRLAGTRLSAWFGHDLKGMPFACLWMMPVWRDVLRVLGMVGLSTMPASLKLKAVSAHGVELNFEMVLLPLQHRGSADQRVLGALVCDREVDWLGTNALRGLQLVSFEMLHVVEPKPVKPPFGFHPLVKKSALELRPHWRVIEGSRDLN